MESDISQRLQELRKKSGHSQEKVSELIGVTRQAISKWENGQGLPDANNLIALSNLYQVSLDYLLKGEEVIIAVNPPGPKSLSRKPGPFQKLLIFLLGFAGFSIIGVLFIFLLALLTRTL